MIFSLINARVGFAVTTGQLEMSTAEVEMGGIDAALHPGGAQAPVAMVKEEIANPSTMRYRSRLASEFNRNLSQTSVR
jgi:hypothetical protein